ncbi:hypothetical protein PR048_025286 [Dryococelus australis]|uniref:Reverse transcriptase domain-containing protein n=1 Tax=Dryococelus australis TaxID=614101 RepID=A0ABQ9GQY0_9NEOP|nr:hypothetical protein PR048_025286 [Dryococelus australis]
MAWEFVRKFRSSTRRALTPLSHAGRNIEAPEEKANNSITQFSSTFYSHILLPPTPTYFLVAERIILSRLNHDIEQIQVLPDTQFGLRKLHSAMYAVAAVIDHITQRFCDHQLSSSTAFSHSVHFLFVFSTEHRITAGVPHRAFLSPTFFSIYLADIPTIPEAHILQYTDDTALLLPMSRL